MSSPALVRSDISNGNVADRFDAVRVVLKEIVFHRPELFPRDKHSEHYHREMLSGDKPFHVACFFAFLERIEHCLAATGHELVREIGDRFFAAFRMRVVDVDATPLVGAESLDQAQLDAFLAVSQFQVLVDEAERLRDPRSRRAAKRAAAKARAEISDVERHPLLAGEAS